MSLPIGPYDSALAMAQAIREGTVTSRQLVQMHMDRIQALDNNTSNSNGVQVNAVVVRDFEGALQGADEADQKVQEWRKKKDSGEEIEELGVFHGVPMTMKESNPTPGFRTTMGDNSTFAMWLPRWAGCEPARVLVQEGGAILMGKTNLPIHAGDWECNNAVYGRTRNPYDNKTSRSPGGSSGGAAAALACGFTPLELGSDIGGSIRIPSVMCGVVGHCPTRGLLPPISEFQLGCSCLERIIAKFAEPLMWMGRIGPMARNVEDVTAMLEVLVDEKAEGMARPRRNNNNKLSSAASANPSSTMAGYRVAVWRTHETCPTGKQTTAALTKTVEALKGAGATVEELEPPVDPKASYLTYLKYVIQFLGMYTPNEQKKNVRNGKAHDSYPSDIKSPFDEMDKAGVYGIPKGTDEAFQIMADAWDDHLKQRDYDAVLCPIFPCEAWVNESGPTDMLSQANMLARRLVIDGNDERYYGDCLFWSHVSVLFGLPATGFPVGFTTEDKSNQHPPLPVGLQAFGANGNDFIVLDVVQKIMQTLGNDKDNFQPPPGFAP